MHCTQSATRNTANAAKTRAKVAHTSFRKRDFSGAIRKYDTRIDIFTVELAKTNNVCPAMLAWKTLTYFTDHAFGDSLPAALAPRSMASSPKHACPSGMSVRVSHAALYRDRVPIHTAA